MFNLHVNNIAFSYETWASRLALRERLKVIRKWHKIQAWIKTPTAAFTEQIEILLCIPAPYLCALEIYWHYKGKLHADDFNDR